MQNQSNKELTDIDKALRRSALSAKEQAAKNGTPYVIYRDSSTGQFLNRAQPDQRPKK